MKYLPKDCVRYKKLYAVRFRKIEQRRDYNKITVHFFILYPNGFILPHKYVAK